MSDTAQFILKSARVKHGLTQIQVAALLNVSVDQIKRMERGSLIPEMSDVDILEEELHEPGLFRRWARAQYPEIVKYFGACDDRDLGLLGAVVNTKHQLTDVLALQEQFERDAIDGRIDDAGLRDLRLKELREAQQAIEAEIESLKGVKT